MTGGRKTRLYRIVVDTWPTPDGRPFDLQPVAHYAQAIDAWDDDSGEAAFPRWMENIPWAEHLATFGEAVPGVWFIDTEGRRFTVPAHRRQHFLSPTGAKQALERLQAWGAHGHIETSDPITWKGQP